MLRPSPSEVGYGRRRSADSAEEIRDTTGVSPWSFIFRRAGARVQVISPPHF